MFYKKLLAGNLVGLSVLSGGVTSNLISSVPTYASSVPLQGYHDYNGHLWLTPIQSLQLRQAIQDVNQALASHQSRVNVTVNDVGHFSSQNLSKLNLTIYDNALRANPDQFQNGEYMVGNIYGNIHTSLFDNHPNQIQYRFTYNNTPAQDKAAYDYAKALVQSLSISSNPMQGMHQIYTYLCQNFQYDKETSKLQDTRIHPCPRMSAYGAFYLPVNGQHMTICTGFAQMFYLMCRAMGWNDVYCVRAGNLKHEYNEVKTNQGVYFVDTCFGRNHGDQFFMKTQQELDRIDVDHHNTQTV